MSEKQIVEMQKHIDALRYDNNILIRNNKMLEKWLSKKSQQLRVILVTFALILTFLGVWIYALYYANGLLATDNQTKENWKRSAIILDGKYNDLQDDMKVQKKAFEELSKTCTAAQIKKAVKNTPLPPMVKDMK